MDYLLTYLDLDLVPPVLTREILPTTVPDGDNSSPNQHPVCPDPPSVWIT